MKELTPLLIFSFFSLGLLAQPALRGKVTDNNGKALAAASVFIPELEKKTTTNVDGTFQFDQVGNGNIRLQCSLIGYLTSIQTIDMSHHGGEVLISLEPTSLDIEEIVVTSNNTDLARNT